MCFHSTEKEKKKTFLCGEKNWNLNGRQGDWDSHHYTTDGNGSPQLGHPTDFDFVR